MTPDRPHPGDDPSRARPRGARASPRRSGRTASTHGVPTAAAVPGGRRASPVARWSSTCAGSTGRGPRRARRAGAAAGARCSTRSRGGDHPPPGSRPSRRGLAGDQGLAGRLTEGAVLLRPIRLRDRAAWSEVRARNATWLRPWDATSPDGPGDALRRPSARWCATCPREARAGRALPFVVEYHGQLVGQLTVGGIAWGSLRAGAHRLLGGPRRRGARDHPDRRRPGRPTTAGTVSACTASRSTSVRRTSRPAGSSRSSASGWRGSARATCTSTATGATTSPTPCTPRRYPAASSVGGSRRARPHPDGGRDARHTARGPQPGRRTVVASLSVGSASVVGRADGSQGAACSMR